YRRDGRIPLSVIWKAHKRGFTAGNWIIMGLDDEKSKAFISDARYIAGHPFNGQYGKWIDDKLTLKYMLAGTHLDRYMPRYYFMTGENGQVMRLMDCPAEIDSNDVTGILDLLKEDHVLAVKKMAGSIGEGFYKAEYRDGRFFLNGAEKTDEAMKAAFVKLKNYLIIEYLFPHEELAEYCPNTCNCLRYLAARIDGDLRMIKSYIRLGAVQSGFVENYNAGGILCYVDQNGYYDGGNIMDMDKGTNIPITEHPDTGKKLAGRIPEWDEVLRMVGEIGDYFPQLEYMGIDAVITADRCVKMLEINSLTSLDGLQLLGPIVDKKEIAFLTRGRKGGQVTE
ncbi:MAG: hypothetical protein J5859_02720, partial [Clostridia bacterium]|nr:hypothetical protein [Clostridia bacterium]